jgi:hypothetical protein
MLQQVFWLSEENALAALIGQIGPDVCSSDEMDDVAINNTGQKLQNHAAPQKSRTTPQRSPEFGAFVNLIQRSGLYYRNQHPLSGHLDDTSAPRPPPDGTPLAWISEEFLMTLMNID